jgi:hypothetical protein
LETKALKFDALELKLSEEFISTLKSGFAGLASNPSGMAAQWMTNPCPPSLCTFGEFIDPFGDRYTCIVLNDTSRRALVCVLVIVAGLCGSILLMFVLRRSVRYSLRALRAMKRLVSEERAREGGALHITPPASGPVSVKRNPHGTSPMPMIK